MTVELIVEIGVIIVFFSFIFFLYLLKLNKGKEGKKKRRSSLPIVDEVILRTIHRPKKCISTSCIMSWLEAENSC